MTAAAVGTAYVPRLNRRRKHMMDKNEMRALSANLRNDPENYMTSFRENVRMYVDQKDITIEEIAERADLPSSTLKSFLYGRTKDCSLSSAIKLAKVFSVSVDELVGCGTISPQTCESLQIVRTLPESFTHFVRWAIHYHKDMLENNQVSDKAIEVMLAEESPDGNFKMTNNFDIIDISELNKDLLPKIFMGIKIPSDRFAPKYFESEILLIANDRVARPTEPVVVCTDDNMWLLYRREEKIDGKVVVNYYSIRDNKLRTTEDRIQMTLGYVAKAIHTNRED